MRILVVFCSLALVVLTGCGQTSTTSTTEPETQLKTTERAWLDASIDSMYCWRYSARQEEDNCWNYHAAELIVLSERLLLRVDRLAVTPICVRQADRLRDTLDDLLRWLYRSRNESYATLVERHHLSERINQFRNTAATLDGFDVLCRG